MHRSRLIAAALFLAVASASAACKKDAPGEGGTGAALEARRADASRSDRPEEVIYAASAHVRVVDTRIPGVAAGIDLQKAITSIAFSRDGSKAFVSASDGVYQVDAKRHQILRRVTVYPARHVELDETGTRLLILEHEVGIQADGARDIKPFRMVTADAESGIVTRTEEIGQRVLYALPSPDGKRHHLVIMESGEVRLGRPPEALGEGKAIDPALGLASKGIVRVRPMVARHGGRAFVAVEGEPSRILVLDLDTGSVGAVDLGGALSIRGLAMFPDGKRLAVNGVKQLLIVDLVDRRRKATIELADAHQGIALSSDGRFAFLAQTIDGTGGAVTTVRLDPPRLEQKVHLDDVSPWVIAVRPQGD